MKFICNKDNIEIPYFKIIFNNVGQNINSKDLIVILINSYVDENLVPIYSTICLWNWSNYLKLLHPSAHIARHKQTTRKEFLWAQISQSGATENVYEIYVSYRRCRHHILQFGLLLPWRRMRKLLQISTIIWMSSNYQNTSM